MKLFHESTDVMHLCQGYASSFAGLKRPSANDVYCNAQKMKPWNGEINSKTIGAVKYGNNASVTKTFQAVKSKVLHLSHML